MGVLVKALSTGDIRITVEKHGVTQTFEISYENDKTKVPTLRVVARGTKVRVLDAESLAADMHTTRLQ